MNEIQVWSIYGMSLAKEEIEVLEENPITASFCVAKIQSGMALC
jgi:hypothetical protein